MVLGMNRLEEVFWLVGRFWKHFGPLYRSDRLSRVPSKLTNMVAKAEGSNELQKLWIERTRRLGTENQLYAYIRHFTIALQSGNSASAVLESLRGFRDDMSREDLFTNEEEKFTSWEKAFIEKVYAEDCKTEEPRYSISNYQYERIER